MRYTIPLTAASQRAPNTPITSVAGNIADDYAVYVSDTLKIKSKIDPIGG
jgi:hypothetical protein